MNRPDEKKDEEPQCSFCGSFKSEVFMLISGPHVFICPTCAGMALDIAGREMNKRLRDGPVLTEALKLLRDAAALDAAAACEPHLDEESNAETPDQAGG